MEVVQLTDEHLPLYLSCLGDCSEEAAREAGPRRAAWYAKMKDRGLRVLLGKDDRGEIGPAGRVAPGDRHQGDTRTGIPDHGDR